MEEKNDALDVEEIDLDNDTLDTEDDDVEYDDDGNVVVSEEEESEEENEEAEEEEPEEEEIPKETAKDKDYESLDARYKQLEAQVKDTLSKLGVKGDDVLKGLVQLAAETVDKTPEEYEKDRDENKKIEDAKALIKKMEFENLKRADLEALKANYPELSDLDDLEKLENFREFAKFRDMGLTPVQAYSAANPNGVRKDAANAAKRKSLNYSKAHLRSNVPKSGAAPSAHIPNDELKMLRSALPGKSDKEIYEIYKKIKN